MLIEEARNEMKLLLLLSCGAWRDKRGPQTTRSIAHQQLGMEKETKMKIWKSMAAILFCSGLILALGLAGCGDDDDEAPQMTCEQALEQFTSQDCQAQASANVNTLKTCVEACANETCVDNCLSAFEGQLPACKPAVDFMFDTCNQCWTNCGDAFVLCLDGAGTGTACLTALNACVVGCP